VGCRDKEREVDLKLEATWGLQTAMTKTFTAKQRRVLCTFIYCKYVFIQASLRQRE
jgi:hypothetical protein